MLKKTIITSGVFILTGVLIMSSVSADSQETDTKTTVTSYEASGSVTGTASYSGVTQQEVKQQEVKKQEIQKQQEVKKQEIQKQQEVKKQEIQKQQEVKKQEIQKQQEVKKQEIQKQQEVKKLALSEKLHTQLLTIVEKLSLDKLTRVLGNIDKAIIKVEASNLNQTRKDNLLAQLEEIRVIIQDKVDVLNGVTPIGINLNDILSGVTTDPSVNTATGGTYNDTNTTPMNPTIDGTGTTTVSTGTTTNEGTTTGASNSVTP
jgi:hypothetical protein